MVKAINRKEYWQENISGFSGFYDKQSEENIRGFLPFTFLYKHTVFHLEKKYMKQRFDMVMNFIQSNVQGSKRVADIGCGSGIYTKAMVNQGAHVYAIDFTQQALDLTRHALSVKECLQVEFICADIHEQSIPSVDVAIAIGVLPYIDNLDKFFDHILPQTHHVLMNFLNADDVLNQIRARLKWLDVRGYSYQRIDDIKQKLAQRGFDIVRILPLATGYMIEAKRR